MTPDGTKTPAERRADTRADRWTRCPHCHYGGPHVVRDHGRFSCGSCGQRTLTLDPPEPCTHCEGTGYYDYHDLRALLTNSRACRTCKGSGERQ